MRSRIVKPKEYLQDLTAIISKKGEKTFREEAWRYNSILDQVRWMGADRFTAQTIAKRCGRTHEELTFTVGDFTIELINERKNDDDSSGEQAEALQ